MNINDTIDLSNRSLDANDLMKLASSVSNSKNGFYRTIKLGSNNLSDDGASIIASIQQLPGIKRVVFTGIKK